jgi:hypothetical protein
MYGVVDLDKATETFERDLDLPVIEGGVFPDGVRSRIIGCRNRSYVELLAVEDPTSIEAEWIRDQIAAGVRLLGWAVETDELGGVAERLGRPVEVGTVEWHDGEVGSWEMVGAAEAMAEPWLPFFIRYPRRAAAPPPVLSGREPDRIAWIEVAGDADRLHAWLGTVAPSVRVTTGPPGIRSVGLEHKGGELVLD